MRVSKVMQEYIKEQVNAKFQPKIQELHAQASEEEESVRNAIYRIVEKANGEALKVIKESPVDCSNDNLVRENCYGFRSPLRDDITDLRKQAEDIIKNIIVELELGGNKQTLERLLQEIEV